MIKQIPHPNKPELIAYVCPFERNGSRSVFWLGTSLSSYDDIAASMGKTTEEYVHLLVTHYFDGAVICED